MYHYGDGANKLLLRTRNGVHLHRTYLKTLVDLDENIKDPLIKKASLGFFYLYDTSYRELAWGSYLYFLEQSFPSITGKGYPDTKAFKAYYPNSKYLIKLQQLQDSIIQERESIMSDRIVDTKTYSNLQSIMDKSEGRYFFIDVWATWCLPCIAEFNHLPALNSFFNKLNIKQVFLSVDELPRKKEWVDFIELQKLPGHHFIINSKVQREILNLMNKGQVSGNLSVPRYLFYDKEKNKYHTEVPRPSTGVVFEDAIKKFMVTE
jgi:thiol-disulfide isomerase/thioredoxin